MLFDGASIWVANATDGTVSKLRASDGQSLGTYPVATNLRALAFDGTNVWALSGLYGEDITLSKVRATDGSVVAKYSYEPLAGQAQDLLFDGTYIWVLLLNPSQGSLMKIVPSDGNVVATRTVGQSDRFLFDGSSIWISSSGGQYMSIAKIRISDLATACGAAFYAMWTTGGIAFDGTHVWVAGSFYADASGYLESPRNTAKLNVGDCSEAGTFDASLGAANAFDGVNIWTITGGAIRKL